MPSGSSNASVSQVSDECIVQVTRVAIPSSDRHWFHRYASTIKYSTDCSFIPFDPICCIVLASLRVISSGHRKRSRRALFETQRVDTSAINTARRFTSTKRLASYTDSQTDRQQTKMAGQLSHRYALVVLLLISLLSLATDGVWVSSVAGDSYEGHDSADNVYMGDDDDYEADSYEYDSDITEYEDTALATLGDTVDDELTADSEPDTGLLIFDVFT